MSRQIHVFLLWSVMCLVSISAHAQPDPPAHLKAVAYESHIEVRWDKAVDPDVSTYRLYRKNTSGDFELITSLAASDTMYLDFTDGPDITHIYTVTSRTVLGTESDTAASVTATTFEMSDEQFLDMVQEYTFRYFWDFAHPVSGLARERNTSGEIVTMGGSGFGIMGILVGIERGYITREQGLFRLLKIVLFLEDADRFYGVYPHWMNGTTGKVIPFSAMDNGGDLVETAFLFQGLLSARAYFDANTINEIVLRQKITTLWQQANWDWYRNEKDVLLWHWSPTFGFALNHEIRGWNEALIIYLLAVASPTHGVEPSVYHTGWAGGNYVNGFSIFGYPLFVGPVTGGPLFFAHYSFMGFDPRFYKDAYANYYIQNRNHTLINRAYCINNPENHVGYSDVCWGLTASDDPLVGYLAHEATAARDNGTIAPTAAVSSMPYTPAESMEALKHFYRAHGDRLWGPMGFYDAFNLTEDWFAGSYIAIDQGPILCMIENHRTRLLWDLFMQNPEIPVALEAIGFEPDSTSVGTVPPLLPEGAVHVYPNPVTDLIILENSWSSSVSLAVTDMAGRTFSGLREIAPGTSCQIPTTGWPNGLYVLRITDVNGLQSTKRIVVPSR